MTEVVSNQDKDIFYMNGELPGRFSPEGRVYPGTEDVMVSTN